MIRVSPAASITSAERVNISTGNISSVNTPVLLHQIPPMQPLPTILL